VAGAAKDAAIATKQAISDAFAPKPAATGDLQPAPAHRTSDALDRE